MATRPSILAIAYASPLGKHAIVLVCHLSGESDDCDFSWCRGRQRALAHLPDLVRRVEVDDVVFAICRADDLEFSMYVAAAFTRRRLTSSFSAQSMAYALSVRSTVTMGFDDLISQY
jgi:hypothetical protein